MFDAIVVPRGMEYSAVERGLRGIAGAPKLIGVPIGTHAADTVRDAVARTAYQRVAIVGVCGLLDPHAYVGETLVFDESVDRLGDSIRCDETLTAALSALSGVTRSRRLLSWTEVVSRAADKRELGALYFATAVDMESHATLAALSERGIAAAIARVASDDARSDIPDLRGAIRADGTLEPYRVAGAMLLRPLAAGALIRGSLAAMPKLSQLAAKLARAGPRSG